MTGRNLRERLRRAGQFVAGGIWDVEIGSLSGAQSLWVRAIRIIHLIIRGFREDECPLRASALTFSSLLALVPILALSLALLRGLGGADTAMNMVRSGIGDLTGNLHSEVMLRDVEADEIPPGPPAAVRNGTVHAADPAAEIDRVVDLLFEKAGNVSFTALGGMGLLLLIVMSVQMIGQVESAFNRVWGVAAGRPFWRKFADYLSVLMVVPVLMVAASSLSIVDLVAQVAGETVSLKMQTLAGARALKSLTLVSATALCFVFVLMFMPNTRVRIRPALTGGIAGALLFFLWLRLCTMFQAGMVARYGRLYGTFAVVPITLIWLYVSWSIVLLAAEVAFAVQHCATYRMEQNAGGASMRARLALVLSVLVEAAREEGGLDIAAFAAERRIPVRFVNSAVDHLVRSGCLGVLAGEKECLALLKPADGIRVAEIVNGMLNSGAGPEKLGLEKLEPAVERAVSRAVSCADGRIDNITIRDLAGVKPPSET